MFHKFALIGLAATGLHYALAVGLNAVLLLPALWSNPVAFCLAAVFNFFANWSWTFGRRSSLLASAPRFVVMQGASLLISQAVVYVIAKLWGLPLWIAMIPVVTAMPVLTFIISRVFVFKQPAAV